MNLLVFLVIAAAIATVWQLIRVVELSREAQGIRSAILPAPGVNRLNGILLFGSVLGFFLFFIYTAVKYRHILLPPAASEHGPSVDTLMGVTLVIIITVFFLTHSLLGWFVYRYYSDNRRKAFFYVHNNRLEIIWTAIPAVVLTGLILYGITVWNNVMSAPPADAFQIEIYGKQFQWFARYAGKDRILGRSNYRHIEGQNPLGLDSSDAKGWDDIVVNELHLPLKKPVLLIMRSQDVIHSAYLPHFRVQMNCVPGMATRFHFIPTLSTEEMRIKTGNPAFDFYLLCNKICGSAHYNMKMAVVVESEDVFESWLKKQATFKPEKAAASL